MSNKVWANVTQNLVDEGVVVLGPFDELWGIFCRCIDNNVIEPPHSPNREIHQSCSYYIVAIGEFFRQDQGVVEAWLDRFGLIGQFLK